LREGLPIWLEIELGGDDDGSGEGAVHLFFSNSLISNGGDIYIGGGGDPTTGRAMGDASNSFGFRAYNVDIDSGGGDISILAQGFTNGNSSGILIDGNAASIIDAGGGSITLDGIAVDNSNSGEGHGVHLRGAATQVITSGGGDIDITGQGGTATGSDGIRIESANVTLGTGKIGRAHV